MTDSLSVFRYFLKIFLIKNNLHSKVFPKSFLSLLLTAIPGEFRAACGSLLDSDLLRLGNLSHDYCMSNDAGNMSSLISSYRILHQNGLLYQH